MEDTNSLRAGYSSKRLSFALFLGGLCILAVLFEAPDAATTKVEESLRQNNGQPLPENVDDFMLMAVKQGSSLSPWRTFNLARKKALALVRPDDPALKTLEKKCGAVRTSAFLQCGKSFCQARFSCGTPCQHPSQAEVVPLTSGYGPKFFNMHEGADKEALKKKQLIARQKKLAAEKTKREKGTKAAEKAREKDTKAAEKVRQEKAVKHKQKQAAAQLKARESALEQAKKAHRKAMLKREKKSKRAVALKASKKAVRKAVKAKKFVKKKVLVSHAEKAASKATQGIVRKHIHELSTKATTQAKVVAKSRQHQQHQAKILAKKKAALAHAAKAAYGSGSTADVAADKHTKELKHKVAKQAKKLSASRKQRRKHAKVLARKTDALKKVLTKESKAGIEAKKHMKHAKELSSKVRSHAKKASAAHKHSQKQAKVLAQKKKLLAAAQKQAQKCQQFWTKQKNGKCVQTCPLKTQQHAANGRCKCGLSGSNHLCYVGSVCKNNLCEDKDPKTIAAKRKKRQDLVNERFHKVAVAAKTSVAASKRSKAQASALAKKKASLAHTAKMAKASAKSAAQKKVHELTAKVSKKAKQLSAVRKRGQEQARALARKKALAVQAAKAAAAKADHQKSVQVRELSEKVSQQAKQLAAARKRSKLQAKALASAIAAPKKAIATSKKIAHRAAVKAVEEVKSHTGIHGIAMKAAAAAAAATLKAKTHTDWAGYKVRPSKGELLKQALKAATAATKAVIQQGAKTLSRKEAARAFKIAIKQKHTKAYAKKMFKKVFASARAKGIAAGLRIVQRAANSAVTKVMHSTAAKSKGAMERHHKLGPAISEERTMKSNTLLKCNKRGQQVYMKCQDRRLARIKIKAKESAFKVRVDKKKNLVAGAHQNATLTHHHKKVADDAAAALNVRTKKDTAAEHAYASAQAIRKASKIIADKIRKKHKMIAAQLGPKAAKIVKAVQNHPSLLKKGNKVMSHHDHKKFLRKAKKALKIARQVHSGAYASAFMAKPSTQAALKATAKYAKAAMRPTLLMQQAPAAPAQTIQTDKMKSLVSKAKAALKHEQNAVKTQKLRIKYEQDKAKHADKDLQAGEKYTQSHRGFLHRKTCADEMRYAFDLCFGRMRWLNEAKHKKNEVKGSKRLAKARVLRTKAAKVLKKDEKKAMAAATAATATATTTPKVVKKAVPKAAVPKAAASKAAPETAQLSLLQSDASLKQRPSQKERKCYRAKMTAYGQCRATVNAAYMECAHWYGKLKPTKGYKK
jgi:hypothetical protein